MKKKRNLLFILLAISMLIMACSLATDLENMLADPTATSAPTATLSPTETSVPTATPTETPTPIPELDYSTLVLTAADFPGTGLGDVSMEEIGLTQGDLSSEDFEIESFFALVEPVNFEIIMGFTMRVETVLDTAAFDLGLKNPEMLFEALLGGMGDISASEPEELPDLNDIGDVSTGIAFVADMEGIGMRIDMVIFRRDTVGSFIVVMYLDGEEPAVPIKDVAVKFDEKIESFLAGQ